MALLRMVAVSLAATLTSAAYPGDVIQYWIDQSSLFINGTIVGGLQTPPTAWSLAITSASMYKAAVESQDKGLDFQQIAVSHAAHNALAWIFRGTRLYPYIDQALKTIQTQILATASPLNLTEATLAGRHAARDVSILRADDGLNDFVDYTFGPPVPGVYQLTVNGYGLPPDDPQVPFVNMFATGKPAMTYLAPPPPSVNSTPYESFLAHVKAIGSSDSISRTQEQTDIALFWRESAPM
ncbi:MAG: hypothetical protein M1839_002517 [Geoglossum umbratile]|nr:MAG: hypothetical protein M1839_002517 [Geoglossum umbratile]